MVANYPQPIYYHIRVKLGTHSFTTSPVQPIGPGGVLVVPPASYYVYADNRNHGRDSREYGPVPAGNLRGIVVRHVRSLIGYDPIDQSDSLK